MNNYGYGLTWISFLSVSYHWFVCMWLSKVQISPRRDSFRIRITQTPLSEWQKWLWFGSRSFVDDLLSLPLWLEAIGQPQRKAAWYMYCYAHLSQCAGPIRYFVYLKEMGFSSERPQRNQQQFLGYTIKIIYRIMHSQLKWSKINSISCLARLWSPVGNKLPKLKSQKSTLF